MLSEKLPSSEETVISVSPSPVATEHTLKVVATGGRNAAVTNAANTHIEVTKAVITTPVGSATGIVYNMQTHPWSRSYLST